MVRIAAFAGGPAIKGDAKEALGHLTRCHEEGGQLAPWATVVLLMYYTNFKCMTGESNYGSRVTDFDIGERLLAWAEQRYANSGIFTFFRADLLAAQQRL